MAHADGLSGRHVYSGPVPYWGWRRRHNIPNKQDNRRSDESVGLGQAVLTNGLRVVGMG